MVGINLFKLLVKGWFWLIHNDSKTDIIGCGAEIYDEEHLLFRKICISLASKNFAIMKCARG